MSRSLALPNVCEQYAEGASSLALTRRLWLHGYRFGLRDLRRLDERLDAHLDGLLVSGESGRAIIDALIEQKEPGAAFVHTVLGLVHGDSALRDWLVGRFDGAREARVEVDEAMAWTPYRYLSRPLSDLLESKDPHVRRIALASSTAHRVVCDRAVAWLDHADLALACEALRHVGTLRVRMRAIPPIRQEESRALRYWTAWARLVLGSTSALQELVTLATEPGEYAREARDLCLIAMSVQQGHELLRDTTIQPEELRQRIVGSALVGDPRYVPWLTDFMRVPALARIAGETFCAITGVDLVHAGLDGKPAVSGESPDDDPDTPLVQDPDDGVLWPDADKVSRWWLAHRSDFRDGERYLCGHPVSAENCLRILRTAYQRHRLLAAIHLGLTAADVPLFDVGLPAWRQQTELDGVALA